jgi:hypothetical protein
MLPCHFNHHIIFCGRCRIQSNNLRVCVQQTKKDGKRQ